MNRPDFSNLLVHFTTDRDPCSNEQENPGNEFIGLSAYDRLVKILNIKRIVATNMPWTGKKATCFTECPWPSLVDHSRQYSSFGIGFMKPRIFAAGGGPVYYVRADHWRKQDWDDHVKAFVTPFWPGYRSASFKTPEYLDGKTCDYSHEREWRIPHDFTFEYENVEVIILKSYEDMARFPKELKDNIGRERFILMDQYEKIENLWPIHRI